MKRASLTSALLLVVVAALAAQTPQRLALRAAAETIKAADLLRDITYLASDELAGRATPSPGQDLAATYVEDALKQMGIKPFGDKGGYRQHYVVTRTTLGGASIRVDERTFQSGTDFVVTSFLKRGSWRGRAVHVGNGIRSPKLGWDPYKGVDVRGKWMIVTGQNALPEGVTRAMLGQAGVDHMMPAQEARTRGALGLIYIPQESMTSLDAVTPKPTTARDLNPSVGWAYAQNPLPSLVMSKEMAALVVANPTPTIALSISGTEENTDAYNVVGIIEGSDPSLKEEYITMSSHLDGAVGRTAVNGDSIYNAADDNASGSAGTLAIARALTQGPRPRRTVVLIWDTGEETGLWGSRHIAYGAFSNKIVAHLCVDMIGRTKQPGTNLKGEEDLAGGTRRSVHGRSRRAQHADGSGPVAGRNGILLRPAESQVRFSGRVVLLPAHRRGAVLRAEDSLRGVLHGPAQRLSPAVRRCVEDRSGEDGGRVSNGLRGDFAAGQRQRTAAHG